MNPIIQLIEQILVLLAIGAASVVILIIGVILCFHFPRKCPQCGKYWAVKSNRDDSASVYTAGGYINSSHRISYTTCTSCGFVSKPILWGKHEWLS